MKNQISFYCFILILMSWTLNAQNAKSSYKIVNRFHVEGDGGWDYIASDDNSSRLFISHGMITQVIDSKTGKLLGTIQNTPGVHGIAIDPKDNKAYISCGRDSSVSVVNLTTLQFLLKIKVTGANPDAILYDSFSGKVFVYNGRSSNATIIDAKTDKVIETIALPGKPEFSACDGNGKVYANIEDKSLIVSINSKTLKVENTWPIAPGEEPSGLAIDAVNHRLFSVCDNKKMVVVNADNGKVITTVEIGNKTDGCAFDPALNRAYSSNGEGTMTIVQGEKNDKYTVKEIFQTQKGARTICIDKKTHHIFLPVAETSNPPEPTKENPHPRPSIKPGTFSIIEIAPDNN